MCIYLEFTKTVNKICLKLFIIKKHHNNTNVHIDNALQANYNTNTITQT